MIICSRVLFGGIANPELPRGPTPPTRPCLWNEKVSSGFQEFYTFIYQILSHRQVGTEIPTTLSSFFFMPFQFYPLHESSTLIPVLFAPSTPAQKS